MNKNILFLFIIFTSFLSAQNHANYSKVKIWLLNNTIQELGALNIATDHGSYKTDTWFITDLSKEEIAIAETAGFDVEVLIEDVQVFYKQRNLEGNTKGAKAINCGGTGFNIPTVANYNNGSMGGFFTYQEMLNNLDSMVSKYPNLISARAPISTFTSIESRPIFWLRISNTPNTDDFSKPEILYSALHHAREPASMQQLIYYMWYVLENYDSNPELAYIVNNVEMYFVPCINPDGYLYNEFTDPNGGGMHRKNRRNVGGGNRGIDLNRNYAYEFGGVGSSGNPSSDTYRGASAFSEPETQAMQWLTENHEFKIALNYHSYADALLFPWGYENSVQCPDHDLYLALTDYMVSQNNYDNYQSAFLYEAAGDSDDWGYGEQTSKQKVFSMTPEVGSNNDGFWPNQNSILGICRENVFQNYAAAQSLLDNYKLNDLSSSILNGANFDLDFELQRLGLQNTDYTLNLSALNVSLSGVNNPQIVTGLDFGMINPFTFSGIIDPASVQNNEVTFVVSIATANFTFYDTIVKYFGNVQTVYQDNDGDMSAWSATSTWGKDNDAYSPPTSTSDSPSGNYSNGQINALISNSFDLINADIAVLEFYAKWDIEQGYDYVQVSASSDGGSSWTPLCGQFTVIGNDNQDENQPLYDGVQNAWVKESMSLNDFIGENVQLRFRLVSDNFEVGEGFKFDDLKVVVVQNSAVQTGIRDLQNNQINIYPNPAKDVLNVQHDFEGKRLTISIQNVLGQELMVVPSSTQTTVVDISKLSVGSYLVLIEENGVILVVKQFLIY
jgi:hypothetical protein